MSNREEILIEICDLLWLKHNMEIGPNGWHQAHCALTERINNLLTEYYGPV